MSTDEPGRTDRPRARRYRVRVGGAVEARPTEPVAPAQRVRVGGAVRRLRLAEAPPERPKPPAPDDWQERIEAARVEGRDLARRELTAAFETALRDLEVERVRLRKRANEWAEAMSPHLLDLALEIARRLVAHDVEQGAVRIAPLVDAVVNELRAAGETGPIAVLLHPDDLASLLPLPADGRMAGVNVAVGPEIARGDCRLRTDSDTFAVTLAARLDEIRRSLDRREPGTRVSAGDGELALVEGTATTPVAHDPPAVEPDEEDAP